MNICLVYIKLIALIFFVYSTDFLFLLHLFSLL